MTKTKAKTKLDQQEYDALVRDAMKWRAQENKEIVPILITSNLSFEVYPHDAPKLMTWTDMTAWAKSLGDGWRLPTRIELLIMYENKDKIPGLVTESSGSGFAHWYWSCTERRDHPSDVWYVRFSGGDVDWDVKDGCKLSGRVVRAELPAQPLGI